MGLLSGIITSMLMFTILHDESEKISMIVLVVGAIIGGAISGLIIGAIIGLIYAVLYNTIPGKTAITKGIATGVMYFVIQLIIILLFLHHPGYLEYSEIAGILASRLHSSIDPALLSLIDIGFTFILTIIFVIFGYLLGWFWNRFKPKEN